MSRLLHFLCIGLILFLFTFCKKEEDTVVSPGPRLSRITYSYGDQTFQYDEKFRLIRENYSDGSYMLLSYSGSEVTFTTFDSTGTPIGSSGVYTLDSRGLAVSAHGFMSNTQIPVNLTSEYDQNGFLIKEIFVSAEDTIYKSHFKILNGNTVLEVNQFSYYTDSVFYEYIPNTVNTTGIENMGISFHGRQNTNLILSITSKSYGGIAHLQTASYEFDNRQRVVKLTWSTGSGNDYLIQYGYTE